VERSKALGARRADAAAAGAVLGEDAVHQVVELGVDTAVFVAELDL
jgi:hypothetical protein